VCGEGLQGERGRAKEGGKVREARGWKRTCRNERREKESERERMRVKERERQRMRENERERDRT